MSTPGPSDGADFEPVLTPEDRQDLACLDFYLAELDRLRDRRLLAADAHATVAAEARSRREAVLRRSRPGGAAARSVPTPPVVEYAAFPLAEARAALRRGDDAAVVSVCTRQLEAQPDHLDATVLLAFARQRQGEHEKALTLYRRLRELQPENATWGQWVRTLEQRVGSRPKNAEPAVLFDRVTMPAPGPVFVPPVAPIRPAPEPGLSWSGVAGEFLKDHWQKLILCLAVLLIVVSSNVGAYQLLGPKLWSPVGKCVLALVYSAMFAGLGVGLVKWGAERAGRIMLLTTLIVVPANFMLAGQMKLLTEPSGYNLAVLGLDAAGLFLLIALVTSSLQLGRAARFLSAALFVLSAFNAAASPGSPWPWGWQFSVFLVPAAVFLGSVVWLTTRLQSEPFEGQTETTYFALGLLAFAFVSGLIRTGGFALELAPTLYSLPVMTAALACVIASSRLDRFDPDPLRKQWMRFAGLILSGLAFTLAMARPPGPSALLSGNTLATALLGLAMYAALLRSERRPAYLYIAFGALIVSYFGAFYFAKDLVHAVEEGVRRGMGYPKKLPEPFRAINGLVFSPLLAALSIYFRRAWGDDRLAKHCHYLGVPFSIAACAFSGFEPKAALICLSGYAVLYAVAVRVFSAPWVTYLATAALAGAVYFGSTLWPGTTVAGQAFGGSVLGLGYWLVATVFRFRGVDPAYRRPLDHAALGASALAIFGATLAVFWLPGAVSLAAAATFLVVALTAVLVNRDETSEWLAYAAVVCGNTGLALLTIDAGTRLRGWLSFAELAAAAAGIGLVGTALGDWLRRTIARGEPSGRVAVYPRPLAHGAFVQIGLAVLLCGVHTGWLGEQLSPADFATMAVALGWAAGALAVLTRPYPVVALAHLATACGLGVWLCMVQVAHGGVLGSLAAYAAACAAYSAYSVALIAAEEAARAFAGKRKALDPDFATAGVPGIDLFAASLPGFEVGLVLAAAALVVAGFRNGPEAIFTFAAGSLSTLWATRLRRSERLVDLGLALAVAACFAFTGWRVGWADFGYGLAWAALTSAACSFALRFVGLWCSSRAVTGLYVAPCLRASALLTWPVFVLAVVGRLGTPRAFPVSVAALGLNAAALVLLAVDRRRPVYTYRAVLSAVFAAYVVVFSVGTATPDSGYVLGLVAVSIALVLSAIGFVCRWWSGDDVGIERVFARPLFDSALALSAMAIVPAYRSPWTMLLVGLSFLVLVKGIPARHWLYATIASWACAIYFGVLVHWPPDRLVTASMVGAYQLWLVGLLVRNVEPALIRRLRLPDRGYDYPFFNAAAVSCLIAVALRVDQTWGGPGAWSDSAGLALNVAGFLLLMVKPYPHVAWVHGSVALASVGVGLAAYPRISADLWWVALGAALANVWAAVARVFRRYGSPVCRRLGITGEGYSAAVALWSRGFCVLSIGAVAVVVLISLVAALSGAVDPAGPATGGGWSGLLAAIALCGVYVVVSGWDRDRAAVAIGLEGLLVLAVWWLAAPLSPLVARYGVNPLVFLPLSTAVLAVATVGSGLALANRPGWRGAFWQNLDDDADPVARLDAYSLQGGLGLALIAALMTRFEVNPTTVGTLALATAAPALAAVVRRWVAAGYSGALTWTATGLFAALVTARRFGDTSDADRFVMVAVALLAAAGVLWLVAGFLRRGGPKTEPGESSRLPAGTVALALEQVALAAGVVSACSIVASLLDLHEPGRNAAVAAVGVLLGLALLAIGLIARWGEEWLAYAAQGSLLGGYLYYRHAFPIPAAFDAAMLSLFGYLDLGLAEVLHRVGLGRFSRPTRYFALALPVLPLALGLTEGGLGGSRLFILFTAATFYGVAGQTMRWKSLGYAAAVLYNAFLWLLWGRIGWTLADRPQFFLIPVGLSAILFAEVEREALGRQAANAIRGVGLSVVYLSLAFPVWQFASLGAWVTLLLVSLAGIFAGIGLRVQVFLWLGLVGFVLDVVYQLGRMGLEHTLAKWGIMLGLGLFLFLFVALNEKKRIVPTMLGYLDEARQWD